MVECGFGYTLWTFIRTLHHSICIHKHSFIAFVLLSGCFGKRKKWSFMFRHVQKRKKLRQEEEAAFYVSSCTKKKKLRQEEEAVFYVSSCTKKRSFGKKKKWSFMLRCVRKEGKVFFRLRLKILISSTSKRLNKRVRIYYKV
jgi:hypothetical protein